MSSSISAVYASPVFSQSTGYIEKAVKPGIVLCSFTKDLPVLRQEEVNAGVIPSHSKASNTAIAIARMASATPSGTLAGISMWEALCFHILRLVVIPLSIKRDLAKH